MPEPGSLSRHTVTVPAAVPRPTTRPTAWRRYRWPVLAAIPVGLLLGALADLAFSLETVSAPDEDRLPALLAYAGIGAAFSAIACAGAVVAVLAGSPQAAGARPPFVRIAAGAGLAVGAAVLLAGGVTVAVTASWGWFPAVAVVALVTGLLAAAVAPGTTAFFEFKDRLLP